MEKFKNALKSVNIFGLSAILLVSVLTFGFKADSKTNNSKATRYWYYNSTSNDPAQFKVATNYATSNNSEACVVNAERPCKIFVNADNATQLQSILTPLTPDDISDMSEGHKQ
ncbi:hypothetical protein QG516_21235 [Pedobacter gandavensis]|uniref:hypothetical protein n=1 Tax=Pedobacter TaxID=84567 RepID=UPI001C990B96|nr:MULTISPECIES: hypothetical protein [Pedobacter]WGQ09038.1 hypothetical protein QG516_21235 [Pedobacter gandavensis]